MSTTLWIPTWSTFYRFQAGTPSSGLRIIEAALDLPTNSLQPGELNPVWGNLQDLDLGGAPLTRTRDLTGLAQVEELDNTTFLPKDQLQLICAVGGNVTKYPCFLKLDDEDALAEAPPEGWPNRTYYDSQDPPQEQQHSWASWMSWSAYPEELDGAYYLPNNNPQDGGRLIDLKVIETAGIDWITVADYKELKPDPEEI